MYGVPVASLKDYAYDNTNYGFENLPIDGYRLTDEEFVGAQFGQDTQVAEDSDEDRLSFFE